MMGLYSELDHAAWQLEQSAKGENAKVRERIRKLCCEMRGLREYVLNVAKPVDFVKCTAAAIMDYTLHPSKYRVFCDGCGRDIALEGGWVFPQEPKKRYCLQCQSRKFNSGIDKPNKEAK